MNALSSFFKRNKDVSTGMPAKDPVCGMKPTDSIIYKYQEVTYKFCSDYCKQQFQADPEAYI